MRNCDFHNPDRKCPHCGFVARDVSWQRNCPQQRGVRPPAEGPGTELSLILEQLGFKLGSCQAGCKGRAKQMNSWGVNGCRGHRGTIIGWLKEGADAVGWKGVVKGVVNAALGDFWPNPLDVYGSIVDESIARAEAKGKPQTEE